MAGERKVSREAIDKLRHSATASLFERRDVIIVASVSRIYSLGSPEDYRDLSLSLKLLEFESAAMLRDLILELRQATG